MFKARRGGFRFFPPCFVKTTSRGFLFVEKKYFHELRWSREHSYFATSFLGSPSSPQPMKKKHHIPKPLFFIVLLFFSLLTLSAQYGGSQTYALLQKHFSAKVNALGIPFSTGQTHDLSEASLNPTQLSQYIHQQVLLNYAYLFSGIQTGGVAYAHSFGKHAHFSWSLQFANYGKFQRTDVYGQTLGEFSASDYVFALSWGRMLDSNFYIGSTIKPVISQYEDYSSFALGFDVGLSYRLDAKKFSITLLARNFGYQIDPLYKQREKMPFSLDLVLSKRLNYAPFSIYLAIVHLEQWNLRHEDPLNPREIVDPFTHEITTENPWKGFIDNGFRHLDFGIKADVVSKFSLALGYSWRRNQEMALKDVFSLAGFSYGVGFSSKHFEIAFARNEYHKQGATNNISFQMRF